MAKRIKLICGIIFVLSYTAFVNAAGVRVFWLTHQYLLIAIVTASLLGLLTASYYGWGEKDG